MLSHKIGLIIAVISVSSIAMADNPFKVDWTLNGTGEPIALDKDSYSFKAAGMSCEVTRAVKEYAPDLGLGLTETRSLACTAGKKKIQQTVYCTRKETSNVGEVAVGSTKLQLSCNTQE